MDMPINGLTNKDNVVVKEDDVNLKHVMYMYIRNYKKGA